MRASLRNTWLPRLVTFGLAAVAAGSAAFWTLQGAGLAFVTPTLAVDVQPAAAIDAQAVARALGGSGAGVASTPSVLDASLDSSRFVLTGVVASNRQRGAALIAVDGKPAKPYTVGSRVGDVWMLKSVQPRGAVLARIGATESQVLPGAVEMVLELPVLLKVKNSP
jgi:general secretion pathway protein C